MKFKKNNLLLFLVCATSLVSSAQSTDPLSLVKNVEKAMGGWDHLYALNDVQFTYDYLYPQQGIKDLSEERYIFEGEHSWAKYTVHQINVMPESEGIVIQSLVDNKAACSSDGKAVSDEKVLGSTDFLRRANYFWFTMMFKLADPGTIHEYMGSEVVDGITYEKVKVSYDGNKTGKEVNDGYLLYINPKTFMVDQFYFSLPAMGVNEIALKMKVAYQEVNGVQVPFKRYIYMPGKDGKLGAEPALVQTSTDIKFNNGFKPEDLKS